MVFTQGGLIFSIAFSTAFLVCKFFVTLSGLILIHLFLKILYLFHTCYIGSKIYCLSKFFEIFSVFLVNVLMATATDFLYATTSLYSRECLYLLNAVLYILHHHILPDFTSFYVDFSDFK